jgi:tetratricopeptide (TPR) repeat protein
MFNTTSIRIMPAIVVALAFIVLCLPDAMAQRGNSGGAGKAKPSMANVGGGGARAGVSHSSIPRNSNPSAANLSRPNSSQPSFGNVNARPSMPKVDGNSGRPPSMGGSRPSLGGAGSLPNAQRPNIQRPPSNPSIGTRPSLPTAPARPTAEPPKYQLPSTRPSTGIEQNRPSLSVGGDRPSFGNVSRPTTLPGVATRPGNGVNRPSTLPGNIERPAPGGNRPGTGINRPTTLPGNIERPAPGGNRPGTGINRPTTLPGNIERPVIGGNRPNVNIPGGNNNNNDFNRPNFGGNNVGLGNNTNINIGNSVNIGNNFGNQFLNRPNWDVDPGFSRPGWGLNAGNNWNSNWHNNCINAHHNWYNGCWHGHWGSSWYAPVVWGGIGWGLGTMTNSWGMGYSSYYNPYYAEPLIAQSMPYDYSQPVMVNNYVSSAADTNAPIGEPQVAQPSPSQTQALSSFDEGLAKFKDEQYIPALSEFNASLKELPGDPVVHEVRSLALFAIGDYKAAAAGLNSLLSSAPGMDWTTMSSLYGNSEDYTKQLRKLEQFCISNPTDASAHFVLAYHYLVTDSKDAAIDALKVVVANQPKDVTAKRMLDALAATGEPVAAPPANSQIAGVDGDAPQTDLVGSWIAESGDTRIELSIAEDSQFTWRALARDRAPVELAGQLAAESDGISLETREQGAIGGTVTSKGPDNWTFAITGAPASDPGLDFTRIK